MMCRQNYIQHVVLVAFFFLFTFNSLSFSTTQIPTQKAREITYFILYNYDNLIADFYEQNPKYKKTLVNLLLESTDLEKQDIEIILNDSSLNTITQPILYMKSINSSLKKQYNYTFL